MTLPVFIVVAIVVALTLFAARPRAGELRRPVALAWLRRALGFTLAAISRIEVRRLVLFIVGFLAFVGAVSAAHNLFFPVVEPFGYAGIPTWKLVFGAPTFFVPHDFSGCSVFGPRVYPVALAMNIATYVVVAVVVSRLGPFRNSYEPRGR